VDREAIDVTSGQKKKTRHVGREVIDVTSGQRSNIRDKRTEKK
jgi:hypothetical protein